MKRIVYISFILLMSVYFTGCKEEPVGQTPTNTTPPGCIMNPTVKNLPGGAEITYDLPTDNDLLCVKAIYTINGEEKNTTASMYNNTLKVEGFGSTDEQTIKLYSVDRSFNMSEPVSVTIHPTTPPVQLIYETLSMQRDFGGVQLTWKNETKAEVAIQILATDSLGELTTADVVYTSSVNGKYSLRGFDDSERVFGAYICDRWDNNSDTIQGKYTPYFEMKLDKKKWKKISFLGDNTTVYGGWYFEKMWDDIIGEQGWLTNGGNEGKFPIRFTIDLGTTVKLSRYKLWHRDNVPPYSWLYLGNNPKKWKVYGSASPRFDLQNDEAYWKEEGYKKDWVYLADCVTIKPSGEGPVTQEDADFATAGFEFIFPLDAPPVRYLRFEVNATWAGGTDMHISEITCWGNDKESTNQ